MFWVSFAVTEDCYINHRCLPLFGNHHNATILSGWIWKFRRTRDISLFILNHHSQPQCLPFYLFSYSGQMCLHHDSHWVMAFHVCYICLLLTFTPLFSFGLSQRPLYITTSGPVGCSRPWLLLILSWAPVIVQPWLLPLCFFSAAFSSHLSITTTPSVCGTFNVGACHCVMVRLLFPPNHWVSPARSIHSACHHFGLLFWFFFRISSFCFSCFIL